MTGGHRVVLAALKFKLLAKIFWSYLSDLWIFFNKNKIKFFDKTIQALELYD